jgi:hypothetical protein
MDIPPDLYCDVPSCFQLVYEPCDNCRGEFCTFHLKDGNHIPCERGCNYHNSPEDPSIVAKPRSLLDDPRFSSSSSNSTMNLEENNSTQYSANNNSTQNSVESLMPPNGGVSNFFAAKKPEIKKPSVVVNSGGKRRKIDVNAEPIFKKDTRETWSDEISMVEKSLCVYKMVEYLFNDQSVFNPYSLPRNLDLEKAHDS